MEVFIVLFPGFAQSNDSDQEKEVKAFLSAKEACEFLNEIIEDFHSDDDEEAQRLVKEEKFLELVKFFNENVESCFGKIVKMY